MSKKFWTVVLLIFCSVGAVLSAYLYLNKDKQGPVIGMPAERISYHENEDVSVLLEGVTAHDKVDGDVSNSLMIESIYPSANGRTAKVVYAAMDSSNNVTKEQRMVDYVPLSMEGFIPDETETEESEAPAAVQQTEPAARQTEPAEQQTESAPETESVNHTNSIGEDYLKANIAIVNGSSTVGVASAWVDRLESDGFKSISSGNYSGEIGQTTIYTEDPMLEEVLLSYFPDAEVEKEMPTSGVDITLAAMDACVIVGNEHSSVNN